MKKTPLLLCILLLSAVACRKEITITGNFGNVRVTGQVTIDGEGEPASLTGIEVRVRGTGMSMTTGPDGRFAFVGVADNDLELVFTRSADGINETLAVPRGKTEGLIVPLGRGRQRSVRRPVEILVQVKGVITSISDSTLTLLLLHGAASATVKVDADTIIKDSAGQPLTLADLRIGSQVDVRARSGADGTFTAVSIQIDALDAAVQIKGVITEISGSVLTLRVLEGVTAKVTIGPDTIIRDSQGQPVALAELRVGDEVTVSVRINADGTFTAVSVALEGVVVVVQVQGVISEISGSTLTLALRQGVVGKVNVTPDTVITGAGGRPLSLADLRVGDEVAVRARSNADGTFTALSIQVERSEILVQATGVITAISGSTLMVEVTMGVTAAVHVVAETIIKDAAGRNLTLADLRVGNTVEVTARPNPDRTFTAVAIKVEDA